MPNKKYELTCPNCKSKFDCSEQLNIWFTEFMDRMEKVIKEMKNEK